MNHHNSITKNCQQELIELAQKAYLNAYAPYSNFRVGAALLTERGHIFTGCNVENISYGLSICAERNAITTAVTAEGSSMKLKAIAIANDRSITCSPCGACRQTIVEFGRDAVIIFWRDGKWHSCSAIELLPAQFSF